MGVLQVNRSVSGSTPSRTRLTLISNPQKKGETFPLSSSMFPVTTLGLVYALPDIARLDLAILFKGDDIPDEEINTLRDYGDPEISTEVLQQNILWVWSRSPEDIELTPNTRETIYDVSKQLNEKFKVENVPLITPDIKYKLLRLSTALAGLLHSTDETHEKIIVYPEHVEFIREYITSIYSAPNCALDNYCEIKRKQGHLSDKEFDSIVVEIKSLMAKERSEYTKELLLIFYEHDAIHLNELMSITGASKESINQRIALFKKHYLIKSTSEGYRKRPKFIIFLKKIFNLTDVLGLSEQEKLE